MLRAFNVAFQTVFQTVFKTVLFGPRSRPANRPRRGGRSAQGAALLEVLVSLLLSATALLALASVNATALRLGKLSQHRAHAALFAQDLSERMRANKQGALAGHYDFAQSASGQELPPEPTLMCQSPGSQCSAADMAGMDLAQWRWQVRQVLPQGVVFVQSLPHAAADVWVAWQEASDDSPMAAGECPAGLDDVTDGRLRCLQVRVYL